MVITRSLTIFIAECCGLGDGCHKRITLQRELDLCNFDPVCVKSMLKLYGWVLIEDDGPIRAYCPVCAGHGKSGKRLL